MGVCVGAGTVLPAAAVRVPALGARSLHPLHPRSGSCAGGEAEGGGALAALHPGRAARPAGGGPSARGPGGAWRGAEP